MIRSRWGSSSTTTWESGQSRQNRPPVVRAGVRAYPRCRWAGSYPGALRSSDVIRSPIRVLESLLWVSRAGTPLKCSKARSRRGVRSFSEGE